MIRILSVFALLISTQAFAIPVGLPMDRTPLEATLTGFDAISYNFEGIIALNNCSASLIRLKNSGDDENALVLTNGHCIGTMPKAGEVITNKKVNRIMEVLNPKTAETIGTLNATKILYSTMTGTDMTIYVLAETYREILDQYKIRARVLANRLPQIGEEIDIISGYWRTGYSCKVEAIIPTLLEGEWTFTNSIRYSRPGCFTKGGTSGSPIISLKTGEVIGVNNTGNERGEKCTRDNPCEVDANGNISATKNYAYGQQTAYLYGCMEANHTLNLNLPGCKLAK